MNTIAFKRIDARTIEHAIKDRSGDASTSRDVIAQDGKSYTNTRTVNDAKGQSVKQVQHWERQ